MYIEQIVKDKQAELNCQSFIPKSLKTKLMPHDTLWVSLDGKDFTLKVKKDRWFDFNGTLIQHENAWGLCQHLLDHKDKLQPLEVEQLEGLNQQFFDFNTILGHYIETSCHNFDKMFHEYKIKTA